MHAGIGATLVFGAVPAFALFLFLLADDAAASFIASGSGILCDNRIKEDYYCDAF
jgi:hypothetical protein